jgi:hypothetical protein
MTATELLLKIDSILEEWWSQDDDSHYYEPEDVCQDIRNLLKDYKYDAN